MTNLILFTLFSFLISCSHRGPASLDNGTIAHDSIALGNVHASAKKTIEDQATCFEVELNAKDLKAKQAKLANWQIFWIDKNNQQHELKFSNREPASQLEGGPVVSQYGTYNQFTNKFKACAVAEYQDVKGLILSAHDLPYKEKDLKLVWKN